MVSAWFAWLAQLQDPFCAKNESGRYDLPLISETKKSCRIIDSCAFCQAFTSNRDAFDIVWEDADFLAFRDRRPACMHHIQLIPKGHISSVRELTKGDADIVRHMENIGNDILNKLQVPLARRKMGFHIPPFNSVQHLHLHVQALPYTSLAVRLKYLIASGYGPFEKGFSWFSEVGQTIRILEKGSAVGVLPC